MKAFLKAGILSEDGAERDTNTGTPQGGILSPLLANVALSVLDEHFAEAWAAMGDSSARHRRRAKGLATYRLVRYADDFVVLVKGTRAHVEALREETAPVLRPMGLRLSEAKTKIAHIDEGFDFLGFRIRRAPKRGSGKLTVYTYPSKRSLATVKAKVRAATKEATNNRSQPCASGWRRSCGAGSTTSGTACPRRPSTTCASSPGVGFSAGSVTSTAGPHGSGSEGATSRGGARRTARSPCSTP